MSSPAYAFAKEGVDALRRLHGLCATAVISGRGLDDVRARLGVVVEFVAGNHGVKGLPVAECETEERVAVSRSWLAQFRGGGGLRPIDAGLLLEEKWVSLAVRFRQARDAARAAMQLPPAFARLEPASRIVPGKLVFNPLPPSAVDKGTAMLRPMKLARVEAGVCVGDDITDEDAFRLQAPELVAVRVGRDDASHGHLYMRASSEISRLIDALIAELAPRRPLAVEFRRQAVR